MAKGDSLKVSEDIDAERSLLATICQQGADAIAKAVVSGLEPDDFVHPTHKFIFEALSSVLDEGIEVSALSLRDRMNSLGTLSKIGGYSSIIDVLQAEEVAKPDVLASIIKRHRAIRQLSALGGWLQRDVSVDYLATIAKAESALKNILERNTPKTTSTAFDVISEHVSTGKAFSSALFGIPTADTGIKWIDRDAKIIPGTVTVIGARMGVGKTTLAVQAAERAAKQGSVVLFFSLEMPEAELVGKLLSHASQTDIRGLMNGSYHIDYPDDYQYLHNVKIVEGYAGYPWGLIEAEVQKVKPDVVVIDYLEYIKPIYHGKADRADLGFGNISLAITGLTKRVKCATILLAQLHRLEEGHEPHEANLAQTDQVAKDAANIILLFRKKGGEVMGKVAKARYGERVSARELAFDGARNTFREMESSLGLPPPLLVPKPLRIDIHG